MSITREIRDDWSLSKIRGSGSHTSIKRGKIISEEQYPGDFKKRGEVKQSGEPLEEE